MNEPVHFSSLLSEHRNPRTEHIDTLDTPAMLMLMNEEDDGVAAAVRQAIPAIATAVETIASRFREGGRLVYVGAGSSGRLALIDALECPPTFGTPPGQVVAVIAGGMQALTEPLESAEDDAEAGADDLRRLGLDSRDCVVAVSASGRTPYCIGAMKYAKAQGAAVVSLSCNDPSEMGAVADTAIAVVVGPEVVSGSTRLKAGTAQKMVLNMLSTGSMIRTGRVYRNLMIDMKPTNSKLRQRAKRIVSAAAGVGEEAAEEALKAANYDIKIATVSLITGESPERSAKLLEAAGGFVRQAIANV